MFAFLAGCTSDRAISEQKLLSAGFVPLSGTAEVEAKLAHYPAYAYTKCRGADNKPRYVFSSPASRTIYLGDQSAHERLLHHLRIYQQHGVVDSLLPAPPSVPQSSGTTAVASGGGSRPPHTLQQIAPLPPSAVYLPDPSAPLPPPNIPSVIPSIREIMASSKQDQILETLRSIDRQLFLNEDVRLSPSTRYPYGDPDQNYR
jgi:hypothetical protein